MHLARKIIVVAALACALAIVPVALAAGLKVTTTPTHPKKHATVTMKVSGLKPGERVKAVQVLPASGQKNTYWPRQRASASGLVIVKVVADEKGKHVWTFTGRKSHRSGSTFYVVR